MSSIKFFRDYIELEKYVSRHTLRAYGDDLDAFSSYCLVAFDIDNIDKVSYGIIRGWIIQLSSDGLNSRSINRKLASLKAYYKFLIKIKVINQNPFAKHKALKVLKAVQIPFSIDEMNLSLEENHFYDNFQGLRDRLIIEMLYATGMRRAELIGLQYNCVDVKSHMVRVLGKRNKERLIPLTNSCVLLIMKYLVLRTEYVQVAYSDSFFITRKGNPLNESLVYRVVRKNMRRVTTKTKVSPHIIRHSTATHLLNNDANLNDVKELLGHSSLTATQVYTHSSMVELKRQYAKSHPRSKK